MKHKCRYYRRFNMSSPECQPANPLWLLLPVNCFTELLFFFFFLVALTIYIQTGCGFVSMHCSSKVYKVHAMNENLLAYRVRSFLFVVSVLCGERASNAHGKPIHTVCNFGSIVISTSLSIKQNVILIRSIHNKMIIYCIAIAINIFIV